MSEHKPSDDLKEGLSLIFRAARGVVKEIDPNKIEQTIQNGARGLARAIESAGKTLSDELDKSFAEQEKKEDKDSKP